MTLHDNPKMSQIGVKEVCSTIFKVNFSLKTFWKPKIEEKLKMVNTLGVHAKSDINHRDT